jgi:hypothetical protein
MLRRRRSATGRKGSHRAARALGCAAIVIAIAFSAVVMAGPLPLGVGPGAPSRLPAQAASTDAAPGSRTMIAVVRTPDADRGCQEIVNRIVAELMADGVSVVALTCPAGDPTCLAGSGARVSAIVLVQVRDNVRAVEVHASETASGRMVPATVTAASSTARVQRVADADTGGAPATLAVRTVEMLRAMLVEGPDTGPAVRRTAAVTPAPPMVRARPQKEEEDEEDSPPAATGLVAVGPFNLTMNVGVAMFTGAGGLNNAFGPAFSIGRRTSDHIVLSLALAGPGFARDQSNVAGSVSVRREMAAFQADVIGLFLGHLVLRGGMAAGVSHIAIEGHPVNGGFSSPPGGFGAPTIVSGRSTGAFSGLLSWSAGLVANWRPDMGIFVDARLFVLTPTPQVNLNGVAVGRAANPQLALTAGLEFRL